MAQQSFLIERRKFQVSGIVQGVGFRPLVFRLAMEQGLQGWVCNQRGYVTIDVEGPPDRLAGFRESLLIRAQPPVRIDRLHEERLDLANHTGFFIKSSTGQGSSAPAFPPDLATCPACQTDTCDQMQRFAGYPFTSCTYCGPRYTIICALPYDRPSTTMEPFTLCESCRTEYTSPLDRRFHAQTIACPSCGPHVELRTNQNTPIHGDWRLLTQQALQAGDIAAVKGIGGFHLICDAARNETLQRLRHRKRRPGKPFAIMVRDLSTATAHFEISESEQTTLTGVRAPIVLLRPKPVLSELLPLGLLAPGHRRIGVMLPYSPLHRLLFPEQMHFLVITSGNCSGLPIARTNDEALSQLAQTADLFVLHDRKIAVRVEDSVCQVTDESVILLRRSRGYVPESITVPLPPAAGTATPVVLAAGAEHNNTFCLLQHNQAILSQHNGDIDSTEHLVCRREGISHLTSLLRAEPGVVAYDPHPGYLVSAEATRLFAGKRLIPVFHHHAHMAACMAEHGLTAPVIGCILDGTGYGPDGTLWGFEILVGDYTQYERLVHLKPLSLPGGEASIRQPWLVAIALFQEVTQNVSETEAWAREFFPAYQDRIPLVLAQIDGRIPAPQASSAGRLFDAVAALLGLCTVSTYEGEAAELVGDCAETDLSPAEEPTAYPAPCVQGILHTGPLISRLLDDIRMQRPAGLIARKFHRTVAAMVCHGALYARHRTGLQSVVLGGGVWSNRYLLTASTKLLTQNGFAVYAPRQVPAGDGGIALGQAVSALWRWQRNVSGDPGPSA